MIGEKNYKIKKKLEGDVFYNSKNGNYCLLITVNNEMGFHMRPQAKLVKIAEKYGCEVGVKAANDISGYYSNAKRILDLVMIRCHNGEKLEFIASGNKDESKNALNEIKALIDNKFGEDN